jgi:hypothetical protein
VTVNLNEDGTGELKTIARTYDAGLIKVAASCLIYLLSDKSRKQLETDEKLAVSYKTDPGNRTGWEELRKSLQTVKNPLHSDNLQSFTHGLLVTLREVFDGTMTGINLPQGVTPEQLEDAFRSWIFQVANDLVGMSRGICTQVPFSPAMQDDDDEGEGND